MPNGYTAKIYEGKDVTLEEYLLDVAKSFGAFIHMRDDSVGTPLRLPDPPKENSYNAKSLQDARERLRWLQDASEEEIAEAIGKEREKKQASYNKYKAKTEALAARYDAMIAKVKAWNPPGPDHVTFKETAIKYLEESKEFDCGNAEFLRPGPTPTVWAWQQEQKRLALREISYHVEQSQAEARRYKEAIEWITALFDSLGVEYEKPEVA